MRFEVRAVGVVESTLTDLAAAPRQADEDAPPAWLVIEPGVAEALEGLRVGDRVVVLTWLDRARRDVMSVHPRGDAARARQGVFSTRAPHRPNPIGLHEAEIIAIEATRVQLRNLEALDGTPVIDIKPVLSVDIAGR